MNKIFQNLYINRDLHAILFEPVCKKYGLTLTEVHVLMFLNEHEQNNTSKDIVENLKIAKSYVSSAVRVLEERGYIEGCHEGNDRRSVHLHLRDSARKIVDESFRVQEAFLKVMIDGFSEEELNNLKQYVDRMMKNTEFFLREYSVNN